MGASRGCFVACWFLKSRCLAEIVKSKLAGATKSHGGKNTQTSVVEIFRRRYLASPIISSRKRTPAPRSNRPGIFYGFLRPRWRRLLFFRLFRFLGFFTAS